MKKKSSNKSFTNENRYHPDEKDSTVAEVNMEPDSPLCKMSEKEISTHIDWCIKLAAENKINIKNAFNLQLIDIMKLLTKQETNMQMASLGLQASSKIYSGRVDSLYKDAFQFNSNLQALVNDSHKENNIKTEETDCTEKSTRKMRPKSYLTDEKKLCISNTCPKNIQPHSNFETISSAFTASRTAEKLLSMLFFDNDNCKINICPDRCCLNKPSFTSTENVTGNTSTICYAFNSIFSQQKYKLPQVTKDSPEKVCADGNIEEKETVIALRESTSNNIPFENYGTDCADVDDDDKSLSVNECLITKEELSITADSFVSDITSSVTKNCKIDLDNLPPNSSLKKVLSTQKRSRARNECANSTAKPKRAFFNANNKLASKIHFMKLKPSDKRVHYSVWRWQNNSDLQANSFSNFFTEAMRKKTEDDSHIFKILLSNQNHAMKFDLYFYKQLHFWQNHNKNDTKFKKMIENCKLNVDENLIAKFKRLSFDDNYESTNEDENGDSTVDDYLQSNDAEDFSLNIKDSPHSSIENASFSTQNINDRINEISFNKHDMSDLLQDVRTLLVSPPKVVKPFNIPYANQNNSIDVEEAKNSFWKIIKIELERNTTATFSALYEVLVEKLQKSCNKVPTVQFAFVVLLTLANENILFLENVGDKIVIKKDLQEL